MTSRTKYPMFIALGLLFMTFAGFKSEVSAQCPTIACSPCPSPVVVRPVVMRTFCPVISCPAPRPVVVAQPVVCPAPRPVVIPQPVFCPQVALVRYTPVTCPAICVTTPQSSIEEVPPMEAPKPPEAPVTDTEIHKEPETPVIDIEITPTEPEPLPPPPPLRPVRVKS